MSESIGYTPGTGAAVAVDYINDSNDVPVAYQRVKLTVGSDGVATDVTNENPFPIAETKVISSFVVETAIEKFAEDESKKLGMKKAKLQYL